MLFSIFICVGCIARAVEANDAATSKMVPDKVLIFRKKMKKSFFFANREPFA
jgi:hypothetical protein